MSDAPETEQVKTVPVIYTGLDPWTTPQGRLVEFGDGPIDLPQPIADRLITKGWAVKPDSTPTAPKGRNTTIKGEDS